MKFPSPKDYCFDMLSQMFRMLNDPKLCDVNILIGETEFWAHRCVLIAACPTLFDILVNESSNKQRSNVQITLQGLSIVGFNALLLYLYTGQPPDEDNESLMNDFVKCCYALGIMLPSQEDTNSIERILLEEPTDEVIVEVTEDPGNNYNEMQKREKDAKKSTGSKVVDHFLSEFFRDEYPGGDEETQEKESKGKNNYIDIDSLFSVKRRPTRSYKNSLLSKYPKMAGRGRPLVENDHIFPSEPPFKCPFSGCGKVFDTRTKLKKHYYNHDEKKHACVVCSKKFLYRKDLIIHSRIHTGEKPYQCSECHAKFRQKCTLKNHMQTHMRDTPKFPCSSCDKAYSSSRSLHLHIKEKHSNKQASYKCKECHKIYECRSAYIKHIRTDCNKLCSHLCSKCGKKYRKKYSYDLHVQKCTGLIDHKCHLCQAVFKSQRNLSSHIFAMHSTPRPNSKKVHVTVTSNNCFNNSTDSEDDEKEDLMDIPNIMFLKLETD